MNTMNSDIIHIPRRQKVEALLQKEIAHYLSRQSFPRVVLTVTRVKLSNDFSRLYVNISYIGDQQKKSEVFEEFKSHAGECIQFIKRRGVRLKRFPKIIFKEEDSMAW